jgi:hypothetical protein
MIHSVPTPPLTQTIRQLVDDLDRHRHHIEAALEYAQHSHTFDDVVAMVLHGHLRLWSLPNSVMLTEIITYPRYKVYHIFLGGGDLQEILAMHPQVEQAAREAGCVRLSVTGRQGWAKPLKAHGWIPTHLTCTKEV